MGRLIEEPAERGENARKLDQALRGIAEDLASFFKRLLEARAAKSKGFMKMIRAQPVHPDSSRVKGESSAPRPPTALGMNGSI